MLFTPSPLVYSFTAGLLLQRGTYSFTAGGAGVISVVILKDFLSYSMVLPTYPTYVPTYVKEFLSMS